MRVIPDFRFGPSNPISLPGYEPLARTAPEPSEQQLTLAANNAPLRFGYGKARIAPLIANALVDAAGSLLLDCVLGDGVDSILATEINNAALPAGCVVTFYDGTQTTPDSELVAAWALQGVSYSDVRAGVSYAVLKIGAAVDLVLDARSITFEVRMRRVWNPRGKAVDLDPGEYVTRASSAAINFGTGGFTVEGWIKPDDVATFPKAFFPCHKRGSPAGWGLGESTSASNPNLAIYLSDGTNGVNGALALDPGYRPADCVGKWTHVAVVFKRSSGLARCLINGVPQTAQVSIASVTGSINNTDLLYLGNHAGWQHDGLWDEFRLWNTERTDDEIRAYMNTRALGTETGLALCWHFDDGTGTNADDATANNLDGTLQGAVAWANGYGLGPPPGGVKAWSDVPAFALADFLSTPGLGLGEDLNWNSVVEVADRNDELLGGKRRNTIGIVFDEQRDKREVEEVLRGAAGCFVTREGPLDYLVPDAPIADLASTIHLQLGDWQPKTLRVSQRDFMQSPNSVSVRWTNTAVKPWAEAYTQAFTTAEVAGGEVDELATVINGTWIQDYAEAVRLAKRYFAEYTLGIRTFEFEAFEKAYKLRRGSVFRLTNGDDLSAKALRVTRLMPLGFAKVRVTAIEYLTTLYPDDTATTPVTGDSTLPDPSVVVAASAPTMAEEVYLDQAQGATSATGAKYLSRFRATWTHSADRYRLDYQVQFYDGTTLIFSGNTSDNSYVSPPVQQGRTYKVSVKARNVLGYLSSAVEYSAIAQGKLIKPSDVPGIVQAFELGGEVIIVIQPAVDVDTLRYKWRYYANGTGTWESAQDLDLLDGLRATFKGIAPGTHRFYVKAVDTVGGESVNAKFVDVVVTSDADAFLQSHEFTNPYIAQGAELVTGGDFASSSGWSLGTNATISGGKLNLAAAPAGAAAYRAAGLLPGRLYAFVVTIDSITAGGQIYMGLGNGLTAIFTAAGTWTGYVRADYTDGQAYIVCNTTTTATLDNLSVKEVYNIESFPPLEGVWKFRWATSVPGATWNSSITGTVNSVSTPVLQQHFSGLSAFVGESWDLGAQISGDWSLVTNTTVINGVALNSIESSADGTTWVQNTGTAFRGPSRFVRPRISVTLPAGTFLVDAPPKVTLAALAREESGLITTNAAGGGGKLVQLLRNYSIAQDLQVTPANTSSARTASWDRLLVHAQTGLMHRYDYQSGDNFIYHTFWTGSYVVASGDSLEFDVYIDPNSPVTTVYSNGGFQVSFASGLPATNESDADAEGYNGPAPSILFDQLARGVWKTRTISLASHVGRTISGAVLVGNGDAPAGKTQTTLYRNIRVKNGGSTVHTFWSSGEPNASTAGGLSNITNIKLGPSNSFLAYAFNDAGTQQAQDVQYAFKGV